MLRDWGTAAFLATTRQKYCVPATNAGAAALGDAVFTRNAGSLVVPKNTSYELAFADADQPNVTGVATPVAAIAGDGFKGAPGAGAVVKLHVGELVPLDPVFASTRQKYLVPGLSAAGATGVPVVLVRSGGAGASPK